MSNYKRGTIFRDIKCGRQAGFIVKKKKAGRKKAEADSIRCSPWGS
jgi:hypothetical protein